MEEPVSSILLEEYAKITSKLQILLLAHAKLQWLRCCTTNRKVADSIPDGVIGIFH